MKHAFAIGVVLGLGLGVHQAVGAVPTACLVKTVVISTSQPGPLASAPALNNGDDVNTTCLNMGEGARRVQQMKNLGATRQQVDDQLSKLMDNDLERNGMRWMVNEVYSNNFRDEQEAATRVNLDCRALFLRAQALHY